MRPRFSRRRGGGAPQLLRSAQRLHALAAWPLVVLLLGCQGAVPVAVSAVPSTATPSHASTASTPPAQVLQPAPADRGGSPLTTATPAGVPSFSVGTTPTAAPTAFSGLRAWHDVEELSVGIGPRLAGSPAQDRVADFVAGQLQATGLSIERQSFTFPAYDDRGSSLQVQAPSPQALSPQTLAYSPPGEVSGELVSVGLARAGDFDPAQVAGKIALALRGEIRFAEKVANLADAGALAVIVFNNQVGTFSGSLGSPAARPAVSLSNEEGQRLLALLQSGPTLVRVVVDAEFQQRTGMNVMGSTPSSPRTVLIGAHYDSVRISPGANDNASGVATVLELARIIDGRGYPFTVRFVAFGAEELGLLGSGHYVRQLDEPSRAAIIAMLNLDMVGVGDRVSFGGDAGLVARATRLARTAGFDAGRLSGSAGSASDHSSFQNAGVPSLFIHRSDDPHYHTADDRAEYVLPEHLEVAGQLVLAVLNELAAEQP